MRVFCLALLVFSVALTSTEAKSLKNKRILGNILMPVNNLVENTLDNLLGDNFLGELVIDDVLGTLTDSGDGLVPTLLGQDGVITKVIRRISMVTFSGLGPVLQGFINSMSDALIMLVNAVGELSMEITDKVKMALEGIDPMDNDALMGAFASLDCNELCSSLGVLSNVAMVLQAAEDYCATTCNIVF